MDLAVRSTGHSVVLTRSERILASRTLHGVCSRSHFPRNRDDGLVCQRPEKWRQGLLLLRDAGAEL